jgi:L-asparagine oxygenase
MTPFVVQLTDIEIDTILVLAKQLDLSPSDEPELFCEKAKELSKYIPERIQTILSDFAKNGSKTGYLLIRKIPIDILPSTPLNNNNKVGESTLLAKIQSLFVSYTFEMIAYEAEGYGRLFQDIIPAPSMTAKQTSLGSNVELEIHTEQAFSKLKPDILSLACLRGDENAQTYILPIQTIIEHIDFEDYQLLKQPLWEIGVDISFKLYGNDFIDGDIRGPISIINGEDKNPQLIFDQDLMCGINENANELLKKVVDIYYKHRFSHNLKEGEILFVDNNKAVHGRSPFFPKYDGYDRFLVRCFAKTKKNYDDCVDTREPGKRMVKSVYS